MPEPGDRILRAGTLAGKGEVMRLDARLAPGALADFEVDLVMVTRAGSGHPGTRGVLYGAPGLFQRLYTRARLGRPGAGGDDRPDAAHASVPVASFDPLVIRGARLFFNEAFNGNGRTCGTCHPADNNFTIDPKFIASLPPTDPLFVAEFVPALRENFENPKLMRQVGLILENLDGFDDLSRKFAMRGVPHILAMNTSLTPATFDGTTIPPNERTGWSGDGAPGSGTLAFSNSPSGKFLASQDSTRRIGISLEPVAVEAVASFLRVLNALENIRSSLELKSFVLEARAGLDTERALLKLALAEQGDVVEVLEGGGLHPNAVEHMKRAMHHTRLAAGSGGSQRNAYVRQAITDVHHARRDLVE